MKKGSVIDVNIVENPNHNVINKYYKGEIICFQMEYL